MHEAVVILGRSDCERKLLGMTYQDFRRSNFIVASMKKQATVGVVVVDVKVQVQVKQEPQGTSYGRRWYLSTRSVGPHH